MSKSEHQIEREILVWLNRIRGALFWKNETQGTYDAAKGCYRKNSNPFFIKGVSDIIGILNGVVVFLEVKSAKGRESESQKRFREAVTKRGGNVHVVRSIEETEAVLKFLDLM